MMQAFLCTYLQRADSFIFQIVAVSYYARVSMTRVVLNIAIIVQICKKCNFNTYYISQMFEHNSSTDVCHSVCVCQCIPCKLILFVAVSLICAELRKAVYASTNSVLSRSHQHSYLAENEKYDPSTDTWSKTCSDCGHTITFEKM